MVQVYTMKWVGKTGHEFFTGSQDGYVKWWDIRSTSVSHNFYPERLEHQELQCASPGVSGHQR